MIQISNTTNMLLDMQGGFKTEERGGVEVKASFFSCKSSIDKVLFHLYSLIRNETDS